MVKPYQLVGIHLVSTVSVTCSMSESPHTCAAVLRPSWRGEQVGTG